TVSMGVSTRLAALPAAQPKDDREGLPLPDVLTLSSDTKKGNPIQLPSAMLRPDDARSKTTLTRSDAQHSARAVPATRLQRLTCHTSARFRVPAPQAGYTRRPAEGQVIASRFPAAFRLPAF